MVDKLTFLIIEDNKSLLEILTLLLNTQAIFDIETSSVASLSDALEVLKKQKIDFCVCDHHLSESEFGNNVLDFIISEKLNTKFILCSSYTPEQYPELYPKNSVFYNIQKPDVSEGIDGLFQLIKLKSLGIVANDHTGDYISVKPTLLQILKNAPSNIFRKNSDNTFELIIKKGEEIDSNKSKFSEFQLFTLKKDQHDDIVLELNKSINSILTTEDIPIDVKITATHSHLKEIIASAGITPPMVEASKEILQEVVASIFSDTKVADNWRTISKENNEIIINSTLHSIILTIVAKKSEFDSHQDIFKLVYCTFLQDLSLASSPKLLSIIDINEFNTCKKNFTVEEQEIYLSHPLISVEMLEKFPDRPYQIERIILEQHEMPEGNGFPNQIDSSKISTMGAMFNLTGLFTRYLLAHKENFDPTIFLNYLNQNNYHRGHFYDSYRVIKNIFLKIEDE